MLGVYEGHYGLYEQGDVCTVYFSKENPREYQIYPVPDDLENWYSYEVTCASELDGKQYDPSTNTLIDALIPLEEALLLRKEAYEKEADPLYLDAQYDIATGRKTSEEALKPWVEKVAEIKARFPINN
ncbi:TPA: hypothetical protein N2918_002060 [Vibrio parahaemolyticus]|nr:hypothetical protein [Vibrio parahaemolyticus]